MAFKFNPDEDTVQAVLKFSSKREYALEKEIPEINGKLISTTIETEMQSIFYVPTKFFR